MKPVLYIDFYCCAIINLHDFMASVFGITSSVFMRLQTRVNLETILFYISKFFIMTHDGL
jgi:hypothetical protein